MIGEDDIQRLADLRDLEEEDVADWCRRNDVDDSAIRRVGEIYGRFRNQAIYRRLRGPAISVAGFLLGFDARREAEPKGIRASGWDGPRYGVQFVVVDRKDGRLIGDAALTQDEAEAHAGMYNDLDAGIAEGS